MTPEQKWGLLAIGESGQTGVQVDVTCAGEELLAMEITTPTWSFRFRIFEQGIVASMASFLQHDGKDSIIIGDFDGVPVEVRRDRRFPRFFVVFGQGCHRTEFIIAGQQEVADLSSALLQVAEDFK